ncbi:MAG: transporter substrate-binding domain-containing protein [Bacteroidales bacterium]
MKKLLFSFVLLFSVIQIYCQENTIVVKGDNNFKPYEYVDKNGNNTGFNYELLNAILEKEHISYEISLADWKEVLSDFKKGKIDVMIGTSDRNEWIKNYYFGDSYINLNIYILSSTHNRISNLDELRDKKVIVVEDSWAHRLLLEKGITDSIFFPTDNILNAKDIENGKYDAAFSDQAIFLNKDIKAAGIKNIICSETPFKGAKFSFVTRDPALLFKLNRGLSHIKEDGTYQKLYDKWITPYKQKSISKYIIYGMWAILILTIIMSLFIYFLRRQVAIVTANLRKSQKEIMDRNYQLKSILDIGDIIPIIYNIKKKIILPVNDYSSEIEKKIFKHNNSIEIDKVFTFIHPDNHKSLQTILTNIDHKIIDIEPITLRVDYNKKVFNKYYDLNISEPRQLADGTDVIFGFLKDATFRIKAMQALQKNLDYLEAIFDNIPTPLIIKDQNKYLLANHSAIFTFGDIVKNQISDTLSEESINLIDSIEKNVFSSKIPFSAPIKIIMKDSTVTNFIFHANNIKFGTNDSLLLVAIDITEILDLRKNVQEINRRNEIILDTINSGLVYLSTDYTIMWENLSSFCNETFAKKYIPNKKCKNIININGLPIKSNTLIKDAMNKGVLDTYKLDCKNADFYQITAIPIIEKENIIEGVLLKFDNISKMEHMFSQLNEAKEIAEQADNLKSAFLANMSHEIRTPLNTIVGFANLMPDATHEEQKEYNTLIQDSTENLLRLINDILDLSKMEAGFIEIKYSTFDLHKFYKQTYSTFANKISSDEVKFYLNIPENQYIITADRNRLTQVITNFMTNSIKFTKEGSITLGYKIMPNAVLGDSFKVYVTDTGCGISTDKQSRVFGRFEKLNNTTQGTGLGLSICKNIANTAGGQIGFESVEGKGSTFWMIFPSSKPKKNIGINKETTTL